MNEKEQLKKLSKLVENKITKLIESNNTTVELTDNPNREEVSKAWPDNVIYKGNKIFDPYVRYIESAQQRLAGDRYDAQECYLGYSPSHDIFVCGFDMWDNDDYSDVTFLSGYTVSTFDGGKFITKTKKIIKSDKNVGFYRRGIKVVHEEYPDIIDIRLD